jgi:hypothetical protein
MIHDDTAARSLDTAHAAGRRRLEDLPLNLFLLFVGVLLYTPILVLYFNQAAGNFTLASLIRPATYCIAALGVSCLLWWVWPRGWTAFNALLAGPVLYIFISATFYPVRTGVLDGKEREVDSVDRFVHLALMALCGIAAIVSLYRLPLRKTLARVGNALGAFALAASVFMAVSILPLHVEKQDDVRYASALSPKQNVIVLLFDMLQGGFAEDYFAHNHAAEGLFDGFTFYRNAASFAPFTALSYAGFMSGGYPAGEQIRDGKIRDAIYYKGNIIDDMAAKGFATRYFSTIPYQNDNSKVIAIPGDIGLPRKSDFLLFALTTRGRYMPYAYLPSGATLVPWAEQEFGFFSKADARDSFEWFTHNVQVDRNIDKGFVWFHSLMTHYPIRFDAAGRFSPDRKPDDVNGEVFYAFSLIEEFLDRLKRLGVYDNSCVIIISDHGYAILRDIQHLPPKGTYFLTPFGSGISVGQYEPLVMVKKPAAHGALHYDDTAVSLLDLRKSLNEFASPGSGAAFSGFNLLGEQTGSRERTVPVVRFEGGAFKTEDFTNLEHWHTDTLTLPLAEHYRAASATGDAVSPVHAKAR